MDEQDPPENAADQILASYRPPRPRPPTRALRAKAWAMLPAPERARLEQLQRERDENGDPIWVQQIKDDPDDPEMRLLILRPVDEWDTRQESIGRWLKVAETTSEERARAISEGHTD